MSRVVPKAPIESAPQPVGLGPSLSILVVNWNGATLLPVCLDSLYQHATGCEIIVVDNASTDDSLDILKKRSWVKLVRAPKNLGFAGGNNLGLEESCGNYVLLLNNDTKVTPGLLESLCEYLDSNPQVGAVQGKMVLPRYDNSLDVCGSFFTALGLPYHYGYFKPDGAKYQRSYPVFSGKGACLMFRRELIEKIGGLFWHLDISNGHIYVDVQMGGIRSTLGGVYLQPETLEKNQSAPGADRKNSQKNRPRDFCEDFEDTALGLFHQDF